jgi:hypothetical protein
VAVRVQWRPPREEYGVLEHWLDFLLQQPPLLMKQESGSHCCAFGVSDNGIKWTLFVHNIEQELERVVRAAVRRRNAVPHQLSHGILGRFAVGEIPNPRQDIIILRLLHVLVWLDKTEVRRVAEVIFEPLRGDGLTRPVDEVEGCRPVFCQFLDERGFAWWLVTKEEEGRAGGCGRVGLTQLHLKLLCGCQLM